MKKLILVSLTVLTFSSVFAQFEKGRMLAGGSVSFAATTYKTKANGTTNTDGKSTYFALGPKAGYFFIDNLAGGIGLDFSTLTTKPDGSNGKYTRSSFTVSPFVRYYLQQGIFFQGMFGAGSGKYKSEVGNTKTTTKDGVTNWSLGAGYAYFLNSNVAIEPFVGYQSSTSKDKTTDVKDITSDLFINIGFQIYLNKK